MLDPDDVVVADEMLISGPAWIRALAVCIYRGTPDARSRLRAAFPELWEMYRRRAEERAAKAKDEDDFH
jgi:hypothetical protein